MDQNTDGIRLETITKALETAESRLNALTAQPALPAADPADAF